MIYLISIEFLKNMKKYLIICRYIAPLEQETQEKQSELPY